MTWWGCLLLGYGVSFFAGVAADADADMPLGEFFGMAFAFGTLISGTMLLTLWIG